MQLFEFLMVLVSIIIGLGITEILSGAGRMLRARPTIRSYFIHTLFQVGIFLALFQQWWESWGLQDLDGITYDQVLVLLLGPIILFLIAFLLYPDPVEGANLRDYYYDQAPLLWGLVALGTVVGTFLKPWMFGDLVVELDNLSGFLTIPFALILAASRNPRVHVVLATSMLVLLVGDTILSAYLLR